MTMTMINPCLAIALGFGYVESSQNSWLIYKADIPTPSRKEALYSLVAYLYAKYELELKESNSWRDLRTKKQCCKNSIKKDNDAQFCSSCGNNISKSEFNVEDWRSFLLSLQKGDCDSYGEHDYVEYEPDYGWSPWMFSFDIRQANMLIISENAEHILTHALKIIKPSLFDDTDVYANYVVDEFTNMLDESKSFNGNGYYSHPVDCSYSEYTEVRYNNGAIVFTLNGQLTHIKYNTGDIVWFELGHDGNSEVVKIETHDGIKWEK